MSEERPQPTINPERHPVAAPLILLFGALLGVGAFLLANRVIPSLVVTGESGSGVGTGHDHEAQEEVWTCPMHPFVISDQFGACPVCGMDLVLRSTDGALDPVELARLGRVAVSPVERVLANVATVPVGRTDLVTDIRAFGRIVYDETSYATIPAWVSGRIEELYVEETGIPVERGERILSIYSPDLLAAQEEYLVVLRSGAVTESLQDAAERRLRLLGMSRRQIRRLAERGETSDSIRVYAPATGTIVERLIQEGEYVTEGQPLFRLAGLQNIWVEAEIYEQDVPLVESGVQAEVFLDAFPGESFSGIVTLVWPFLDPATRTLRARIELESIDERLRAGMYATVQLSAEVVHQALVVPTEAVIRTGHRDVVYVEVEPNLFERREVVLGYRAGDLFEVISGLEVGEEVVARGGFLIDSEAQLYSGGENLHFEHTAEEQGITALQEEDAFESLPLGAWFCPIDPRESGDEGERCSQSNQPFVEKTPGLEWSPHTDPITYVEPGDWYCPMGAEWVAEESGRCPICGMFLVEKEGHSHETPSNEGSSQGEHTESDHD